MDTNSLVTYKDIFGVLTLFKSRYSLPKGMSKLMGGCSYKQYAAPKSRKALAKKINFMQKLLIVLLSTFSLIGYGQKSSDHNATSFDVNGIELVNGLPTNESSEKLFSVMDYYGAVVACMWSLPATGLQGWEVTLTFGPECPEGMPASNHVLE